MKRAGSPAMIEVEPTTMVVQGLIDGVGVEEVILQPEEKRMKVEAEEVCMDEAVVYEEEILSEGQQTAPHYQNLIVQEMDITEPLSNLKNLLEGRLQCSLAAHQFYLQDYSLLDVDKSLVEQCVEGEGRVQVNLEVKSQPGTQPKINILDILKTEDPVQQAVLQEQVVEEHVPMMQAAIPTTNKVIVAPEETENVTRWVIDQNFRREQERLKIPFDPLQWTPVHVQHWIQWAVKEFGLLGVDVNNFQLDGQQLCNLTHPEFVSFIPSDPGDVFWTHLELLRKCKFVAVMQQPAPQPITTITVATDGDGRVRPMGKHRPRSPRITGDERLSPGNRTGNNGQIQLWQFLLDMLTDNEKIKIISWVGDDGEFKLNEPEQVAKQWGHRKNKPTMNYEKLSRALRYYYDGDMIAKVHGKRFVYKFVCDLKALLGYSARELSHLVSEADQKDQSLHESVHVVGILPKNRIQQRTQTCQTMD